MDRDETRDPTMHVDPGPAGSAATEDEQRTSRLDTVLAGYRRTNPVVPVGAVLVIADSAEREE